MRGRPLLYTAYEDDQAILNTSTKRVALVVFGLVLVTIVSADLPLVGFLGADDWLKLLTNAMIFAVAALGLNILTGLAGQVSLGHAFFMGLGAYIAAWLGAPEGPLYGLGLPIWVWLPLAGIIPAIIGAIVAPTAVRVRGLYLAIVTLGLVFIGEYIFRNWSSLTGGSQSGRTFPSLDLRLWKEETPLLDVSSDGPSWFFLDILDWLLTPLINFPDEMVGEAKLYLAVLLLLALAIVVAKNVQRSKLGRAFQAIRDRDVAAEIMGVNEVRYKIMAFAISSFYAGIAGALLASFVSRTIPERWDLILSVQFIAIILIGGAGTVAGTLMGSAFVVILPRVVRDFTSWLTDVIEEGGVIATIADPFVATSQTDFGLVNTLPGVGPGLSVFQLNQVLFGVLIVVFLIFEPLGLYGIWLRIRNYWKGWPFTY